MANSADKTGNEIKMDTPGQDRTPQMPMEDNFIAKAAEEDPVVRFFYYNQKIISYLLIVVLVGVLGVRWYNNSHNKSQVRSATLMYSIDESLAQIANPALTEETQKSAMTRLSGAARTLKEQNYPYNILANQALALGAIETGDLTQAKVELKALGSRDIFTGDKSQIWQELYAMNIAKNLLTDSASNSAALALLTKIAEKGSFAQVSALKTLQAEIAVNPNQELSATLDSIVQNITTTSPELANLID